MIGTKPAAEAADSPRLVGVSGRGAFHVDRSVRVTERGLHGSDDADMSNDKLSENLSRRNPKDSWGRFVRPGLVGP